MKKSKLILSVYFVPAIILFSSVGAFTNSSIHELSFYGQEPSGFLGASVAHGDVNGDGYDDIIVGEYGYDNNKGRVLIYFGGPVQTMTPGAILYAGNSNEYFGSSVSFLGDVNGDSYGDIIVGGTGYNSFTGRAYVFFGGSSFDTVPDRVYTGGGSFTYFGTQAKGVGDINGDGYNDFMIGQTQYAYLYFGGLSISNSSADLIFVSPEGDNSFGNTLSGAGDINNDGYDDLLIGEQGYQGGTGRVYLYLGNQNMTTTVNFKLTGEDFLNYFGVSMASVGDVNGDGKDDFVIGAQGYNSNRGRAYLFLGASPVDTVADVVYTGFTAGELLGYSVAGAGDFENDGYPDIVIGAPGYMSNSGRAYLYYGGMSLTGNPDIIFSNNSLMPNSNYGVSLNLSGDSGDDGYNDLLIGAMGYSFNNGAFFLYRQNHFADLNLTMFIEGHYSSTSNIMQADTVRIYLRNPASPYEVVDSALTVVNTLGQGTFRFYNIASGNYYLQIMHRNSIESWSASPVLLVLAGSSNIFLNTSAAQVYGSNQTLVDTAPLRYGIYSGDVDRDGAVDATDLSLIDNDAQNFISGYVVTDLTGDDFVDGTDFAVADNNASNFVSAIVP